MRDERIRIYDAQDVSRYSDYGFSVLSGARSGCFAIDTQQEERVAGIQFLPGGAFPFFRMPASEMEEASVDLSDVWPKRADEIRHRLLEACDVDCTLKVLEQCLLEQIARPLELHSAVAYALEQFRGSRNGGRIGAVNQAIGLSPRRFIELFHRQVGLTPKVFCRVQRFQRVLQAVHGKRDADWTRIALNSGYYDQAHFNHDFRSFAGLTPSAYLASATPHLNHVPLV